LIEQVHDFLKIRCSVNDKNFQLHLVDVFREKISLQTGIERQSNLFLVGGFSPQPKTKYSIVKVWISRNHKLGKFGELFLKSIVSIPKNYPNSLGFSPVDSLFFFREKTSAHVFFCQSSVLMLGMMLINLGVTYPTSKATF